MELDDDHAQRRVECRQIDRPTSVMLKQATSERGISLA